MREIKFRAWHKFANEMLTSDNQSDVLRWKDEGQPVEIMQFTGLHDKNGKEIYGKDLLRIKGTMGENSEYKFDCIYLVNELNYEGLSLSFVKLFNEEPDSVDNSYPITTNPSFKYGSLCVDYKNSKYDNLAFCETHGENPTFRQTWKQHDYTNDIEVIGNIYENPSLLNG